MTAKRYFQLSFLLPLVLPVMLFPFREGLGWLAGVLYYSLIFGGVPYVVFAAGALIWMRAKESRTILLMILVSPPIFAIVFTIIWCGFALATGSTASYDEILVYVVFILLVGYGYVIIVSLGFVILRALGWVGELKRRTARLAE